MIRLNPKRILILAPHTDDGEIGCGGSIARFLEEGAEVFYTAFSSCKTSLPSGMDKDILKHELRAAMDVFGIPHDNIILHDYQVRQFPESRQEILQDIIDMKAELNPDLILMPCLEDIHQDHQVIAHEGLRAYKDRTILSYELPWNNVTLRTSTFVRLEERHIDKKIEALSCYKSQAGRSYTDPGYIRALAKTRGVQVQTDTAEVFELVRLVV